MKIYVQYFAILREQRGLSDESLETTAKTAAELYQQLLNAHRFTLDAQLVRVAVNNNFSDWNTELKDGDTIIFIPPVAGG